MRLLVALLLAQNVNMTPIEVRQNGVRLPTLQRQYVVDCRANMTCAIDGGILFLSATGGGAIGKVAEAYMADASITAQVAAVAYSADASYYAQTAAVAVVAQAAYSADASVYAVVATTAGSAYSADAAYFAQVATVAQVAFAADASVYSAAWDHDPAACAAGQFVSDVSPAGALTCSTPAGGGGGGSFTISFGDGAFSTFVSASATVTATWTTSGSNIVFSPKCSDTSGGNPVENCLISGISCAMTALNPGVSFTTSCIASGHAAGNYTISYVGS